MPTVIVRIAPIEQWCQETRDSYDRHNLNAEAIIGKEIKIETQTMKEWNRKEDSWYNPRCCTGRYWNIERESERVISELIGTESIGTKGYRVICEHMLEMD